MRRRRRNLSADTSATEEVRFVLHSRICVSGSPLRCEFPVLFVEERYHGIERVKPHLISREQEKFGQTGRANQAFVLVVFIDLYILLSWTVERTKRTHSVFETNSGNDVKGLYTTYPHFIQTTYSLGVMDVALNCVLGAPLVKFVLQSRNTIPFCRCWRKSRKHNDSIQTVSTSTDFPCFADTFACLSFALFWCVHHRVPACVVSQSSSNSLRLDCWRFVSVFGAKSSVWCVVGWPSTDWSCQRCQEMDYGFIFFKLRNMQTTLCWTATYINWDVKRCRSQGSVRFTESERESQIPNCLLSWFHFWLGFDG